MGRPAVVPPAGRGMGGWVRAPARALGEGGALSPKSAEGTCGRLGDRSPTLGTPRALVDREDSISIGRWAARMGREGG